MLRSWISSRLSDRSGCNANGVGAHSILVGRFLPIVLARCLSHAKTNNMIEKNTRFPKDIVHDRTESRVSGSLLLLFVVRNEDVTEVTTGRIRCE